MIRKKFSEAVVLFWGNEEGNGQRVDEQPISFVLKSANAVDFVDLFDFCDIMVKIFIFRARAWAKA